LAAPPAQHRFDDFFFSVDLWTWKFETLTKN
jgi:hypothetical protein